jgi:hypothetical protein
MPYSFSRMAGASGRWAAWVKSSCGNVVCILMPEGRWNGVNLRHWFDAMLSFGRQFSLFLVGVFPSLIVSLQTRLININS